MYNLSPHMQTDALTITRLKLNLYKSLKLVVWIFIDRWFVEDHWIAMVKCPLLICSLCNMIVYDASDWLTVPVLLPYPVFQCKFKTS